MNLSSTLKSPATVGSGRRLALIATVVLTIMLSLMSTPNQATAEPLPDPICYDDFILSRTCVRDTYCSNANPNAPAALRNTQACLTVTVAGGTNTNTSPNLRQFECRAVLSTWVNGGDVGVPPPHGNVGVRCYNPAGGVPAGGGGVAVAAAAGLVGGNASGICADGSAVLFGPAYTPSIEFTVCTDFF
jgi:hypothetical protein